MVIELVKKERKEYKKYLPEHNVFYGLREKMTDEQEEMINSVLNYMVTIVDASPGTGKTTMAVAVARWLYENSNQKAVYLFGTPQERTLGYRPGDTGAKELDYIAPLIDAMIEIGSQDPLTEIQLSGDFVGSDKMWIEAKSHTFLRGTNLKGKTVIIEETQNMTRGELKKVLTRISDDCTVIIIGHHGQIDLPKESQSGFVPYTQHLATEPYVNVVQLTKNFRGRLAQHSEAFKWD